MHIIMSKSCFRTSSPPQSPPASTKKAGNCPDGGVRSMRARYIDSTTRPAVGSSPVTIHCGTRLHHNLDVLRTTDHRRKYAFWMILPSKASFQHPSSIVNDNWLVLDDLLETHSGVKAGPDRRERPEFAQKPKREQGARAFCLRFVVVAAKNKYLVPIR